MRKEVSLGKIEIYSKLYGYENNKVQKILINKYSLYEVKFLKYSYFAKDIESGEQLKNQLSLFHKN